MPDEILLTKEQWKKQIADKKRQKVHKLVDAIEELACISAALECDRPRFTGAAAPPSKLFTEAERTNYQGYLTMAVKNVVKNFLKLV